MPRRCAYGGEHRAGEPRAGRRPRELAGDATCTLRDRRAACYPRTRARGRRSARTTARAQLGGGAGNSGASSPTTGAAMTLALRARRTAGATAAGRARARDAAAQGARARDRDRGEPPSAWLESPSTNAWRVDKSYLRSPRPCAGRARARGPPGRGARRDDARAAGRIPSAADAAPGCPVARSPGSRSGHRRQSPSRTPAPRRSRPRSRGDAPTRPRDRPRGRLDRSRGRHVRRARLCAGIARRGDPARRGGDRVRARPARAVAPATRVASRR